MAQRDVFGSPGPDSAVYVISVAAELTGLHPQTLRSYERMGLITPRRTGGGGRRYSALDIDRLRDIAELTAHGVGVEGVKRIMDLEHQVTALQQRNAELSEELGRTRTALRQALAAAREAASTPATNKLPVLRPAPGESSMVVWRRGR